MIKAVTKKKMDRQRMVSVNFKPPIMDFQKENVKKRIKNIFPVVCGSIGFFTIMSILGLSIIGHYQKKDLEEINALLNDLNSKKVYVEQLDNQLQIAKKKIDYLEKKDNAETYLSLIDSINKNVPQNVWFSSLEIVNAQIESIKGDSLDMKSIGSLLANLKQEKDIQFKQFNIASIRKNKGIDRSYFTFELSSISKNNKQQEASSNTPQPDNAPNNTLPGNQTNN